MSIPTQGLQIEQTKWPSNQAGKVWYLMSLSFLLFISIVRHFFFFVLILFFEGYINRRNHSTKVLENALLILLFIRTILLFLGNYLPQKAVWGIFLGFRQVKPDNCYAWQRKYKFVCFSPIFAISAVKIITDWWIKFCDSRKEKRLPELWKRCKVGQVAISCKKASFAYGHLIVLKQIFCFCLVLSTILKPL